MDISRVMFGAALLLLAAVVSCGLISIFYDCINAIIVDRANGRKYKTIKAYNAKIDEIESRTDGFLTREEIQEGWHYCPEFDGLLTTKEVLGGDQCMCEEKLTESCYARLDETERSHDQEREATGDKYL